MSDSCPTVKVKFDNDEGFIIINESDFDKVKYKLFEDIAMVEAAPKKSGRLNKAEATE